LRDTRREFVWIVVQPGETRSGTVIDGTRWSSDWTRADLRVVDAEPLTPFLGPEASVQQ
jgi:hypothetical protein